MNLAVIPARGSSKRIPRKNIRPFLGIPLLARTVAILKETRMFDRIVVSTDDDEIAGVAIGAGAEVPFRRPARLSDDYTGTLPVVGHAVSAMAELGKRFEFACCVYPAAILVKPSDYKVALDLLQQSDLDYVFTATPFPYPIQRALRQDAKGGCEMFWPEHRQSRSQDLEPAFHDAGQFYFGRTEAWLSQQEIYTARSKMLLLPRHRVQDIDTFEDWKHAELLVQLATHVTDD